MFVGPGNAVGTGFCSFPPPRNQIRPSLPPNNHKNVVLLLVSSKCVVIFVGSGNVVGTGFFSLLPLRNRVRLSISVIMDAFFVKETYYTNAVLLLV